MFILFQHECGALFKHGNHVHNFYVLALGYGRTINTIYFKEAKKNGCTWMNSEIY
jgi:hypothetical protein